MGKPSCGHQVGASCWTPKTPDEGFRNSQRFLEGFVLCQLRLPTWTPAPQTLLLPKLPAVSVGVSTVRKEQAQLLGKRAIFVLRKMLQDTKQDDTKHGLFFLASEVQRIVHSDRRKIKQGQHSRKWAPGTG